MGNRVEKEIENALKPVRRLIIQSGKLIKVRIAEQGDIPDVSAEEAASTPWLYILYQLLKRIKKPKTP